MAFVDAADMRAEEAAYLQALHARIGELEEAQERHLALIRDLTQAPLPEDCLEARNRVGVLTATCATLRNERDEARERIVALEAALVEIADMSVYDDGGEHTTIAARALGRTVG